MAVISRKRIFLILFLICTGAIFYYQTSHPRFTTQKWLEMKGSDRVAIARDFMRNHYKDGMTVVELKEKLGEPDENMGRGLIVYNVGNDYIAYIVLSFDVSEDGMTSNPRIWQFD